MEDFDELDFIVENNNVDFGPYQELSGTLLNFFTKFNNSVRFFLQITRLCSSKCSMKVLYFATKCCRLSSGPFQLVVWHSNIYFYRNIIL